MGDINKTRLILVLVSYAGRHYQTMSNVIFQALDILYAREEQQNNKAFACHETQSAKEFE